MNRYIDADKLQGRIVASPLFSSFGEDGWFIKDFVIDLIGKQPTANVVDTEIAEGYRKMFEDCAEDRAKLTEENESLRAKGEWEFSFNDKGDTWVNCSQCTVVIPKQEAQTYKYCPYCGAKMDGERKVLITYIDANGDERKDDGT